MCRPRRDPKIGGMAPRRPRPVGRALAGLLAGVLAGALAACGGEERPRVAIDARAPDPTAGDVPRGAPDRSKPSPNAARTMIGPYPRAQFVIAHDGFIAADEPRCVPAVDAKFVRSDDEVFGVVVAGRPRAYMIGMLSYHHVVNDVVAGTPIVVTYCVVCSSGIAFDPVLDGQRLTFGFEGVWQGTAILYDRDTGSLWMHLTGRCFDGPRSGRTLAPLTTGTHTTWAAWRRDHPDTDVMAPDPRYVGRYFTREQAQSGNPWLSPSFDTTIVSRDPRLRLGDLLLGVRVGDEARAYPLAKLGASAGVVEEDVGGVPVTVWYEAPSRTAVVFDARLDGTLRTFGRDATGFHELGTGSRFDLEGRCVEGSLRGKQLARVPSLLTEWYGWFAHHPETTLYGR